MKRWLVAFVCFVVGTTAGGFVAGPLLRGQAPGSTAVSPATQTLASIPQELTSYRDIVKKVLPAVVSIQSEAKPKPKVEKRSPRRMPQFNDPDLPEEFRKFLGQLDQGQLEAPDETPSLGFGSGFLVSPKGVVLTNYHVVDGADQVEVHLQDGRKFISNKIVADKKTDLAIIRLESKEPLPYLEFGNSDRMEIGDRVLAVGAPFGLTGSVTAGIISATGRNGFNMNMYEDFLQTDAAINPGNSGGPLVNLNGKVVGINSAIKSRTGGFQGVGLAISSNLAKNVMNQLLENGAVHRGYLGVQIRAMEPEVASRLGVKPGLGVLVARVYDKSPADKAGIKPGDVITTVDSKPIKDSHGLQKLVAGLPLNKPSDVTVVRDGKTRDLKVVVKEQPGDFGLERSPNFRRFRHEAETVPLDKVGVEVTTMTPEMAEQLGYKDSVTGAVVTSVEPGSLAAQAGLRQGMLITRVDKTSVESADALKNAMKTASLDKGILLRVQSPQGGVGYMLLKQEATK